MKINRKREEEPAAKSEPISNDYKEQRPSKGEEELVESLNKITDRSKKDIQWQDKEELQNKGLSSKCAKTFCKSYN